MWGSTPKEEATTINNQRGTVMADQIHGRNTHKFDFDLPEHTSLPAKLSMDGSQLLGVSAITVRASSNGITNAIVEFEAAVAVQFVGALIAHVNHTNDDVFSEVYGDALDEAMKLSEGTLIAHDKEAKAFLVKRIIEMLMERVI